MKIRLLIATIIFLTGCEKSKDETTLPSAPVSFSKDYQAPVYTDADRLEKLKIAFPAIDKIFKDHFEKNKFPALSYGIVLDGELVYSNSFGRSDIASGTAATIKTNFRIASMSKSFTAVSILRLRDEGKLKLSDPVSNYLPEMAKVTSLTQDSPAVTIENLLTMSAGFPEDNPWGDRQLADTEEELTKFIAADLSFANTPGIAYEYSNLGFGMLGKIIGVVSGKPYQQYINENILKPLDMNDARWEYTEIPKETFAHGYRWEDEQWKEEVPLHDGIFGAMGGLICSVEDFSKYIRFHQSAWPARNGEESAVLKRSSLREMHQMQRLNGVFMSTKKVNDLPCAFAGGYGYGLGYRKDCEGIVSIRHSGGLPGFGSEWRILPDYGIGVVALSNLTYGGLGAPNSRVLDTILYMTKLAPMSIPPSAILKQRQQEIVDVLPSWSEDKLNIFAENFFPDRSVEAWKKYADEILAQSGKIMKANPIKPENQLRGTFIIEGEKKNIQVFFTLTPEKNPLVQQLDLTVVSK